ncbi:forkhead box protein P1-like isoform X2 [Centruroides vittatus]|uniref:forkhead box protein P1-like isoform X2 n=1 Tax=Centruroides vittatus TaxID=120091 RepID=UPI003510B87E
MMDHEGEVAINLSTNQTPRTPTTPNGNSAGEEAEQHVSPTQGTKRSRSASDSAATVPSLLMMNSQLLAQQLLQQPLPSPAQLQQLLQQQQSIFLQQQQQQQQHQQLKQLESVIPHLQEQLQLNMVQQSQILQQLNNTSNVSVNDKAKNNRQQLQMQLQQLALQQHQLMQQLQLSHRQYLLGLQPFVLPQGLAASDLQTIWKDGGGSIDENAIKAGLNGLMHSSASVVMGNQSSTSTSHHILNGQQENYSLSPVSSSSSHSSVLMSKEESSSASSSPTHPLYGHGVCKWPGCENICDDYQSFMKHLNTEHQLDDRSTAQARVQMQVVSQLELQLAKERERLQAMMQHLHMKPPLSSSSTTPPSKTETNLATVSKAPPSPQLTPLPLSTSPSSLSVVMTTMSTSTPLMTVPPRLVPPLPQVLHPPTPSNAGPLRRRLSDKNCPSLASIDVPVLPDSPIRRRVVERANLDITEEIQRNREFYRTADVRPPFTYASLIRQAIIEAPDKQLTLNEIYNWFQNTFCYFRRNAATWKNAIRTNLSLHKCFVRYEDDFGSYWMVDDHEFVKRRHLSRGRPRKSPESDLILSTHGLQLSSQTPSLVQGQSQGQIRSPPLQQSPGLYGESLNASLQAALAENNLSFLNPSMVSNNMTSKTPSSTPTPTSTPNTTAPSFSGSIGILNDTERFMVDVVSQSITSSTGTIHNNNTVIIKQEPESDEPVGVTTTSQDDMSEDMEEEEEEAEDLSLSSSVASEPPAAVCP